MTALIIIWLHRHLVNGGVLQKDVMTEIIDAGADAWEPPVKHDNTQSIKSCVIALVYERI